MQGSIGLSVSWLALTQAKPTIGKFDHQLHKEILNAAGAKALRTAGREWLHAAAADEGAGCHAAILLRLEERESSGDMFEPESLKCKSIGMTCYRNGKKGLRFDRGRLFFLDSCS